MWPIRSNQAIKHIGMFKIRPDPRGAKPIDSTRNFWGCQIEAGIPNDGCMTPFKQASEGVVTLDQLCKTALRGLHDHPRFAAKG